jgi:hypothetical protein
MPLTVKETCQVVESGSGSALVDGARPAALSDELELSKTPEK